MKQVLAVFFVIGSLAIYGQQSQQVAFDETIHDFGTIKEAEGAVTHEFKFVNNGSEPIVITKVQASCGCTTPGWTQDPVAPGQAGFIKAQYTTTNRPGSFHKSLTVTTNVPQEQTITLYIKGHVTPKPKSMEEEYPQALGGLRVKYSSINVGKVLTSEEPTIKKFDVYNATQGTITFLEQVESPEYIDVTFEPHALEAGKVGKIIIIYKGSKRNDFGFVSDNIVLHTDEPQDANKSFSIYATVMEYFPPMSKEELAEAPVLSIDKLEHDLGKIQQGTKHSLVFTLTNTGKKPLNIRKAKSTCGCIVTKIKKKTLKSGKSTEMELIFDTTDRRGIQQKSVSIFTNDPKRPAQRVTVKASVSTK